MKNPFGTFVPPNIHKNSSRDGASYARCAYGKRSSLEASRITEVAGGGAATAFQSAGKE